MVDEYGVNRFVSLLNDVKYTCSVHQFCLKLYMSGLFKSVTVKRGYPHCPA